MPLPTRKPFLKPFNHRIPNRLRLLSCTQRKTQIRTRERTNLTTQYLRQQVHMLHHSNMNDFTLPHILLKTGHCRKRYQNTFKKTQPRSIRTSKNDSFITNRPKIPNVLSTTLLGNQINKWTLKLFSNSPWTVKWWNIPITSTLTCSQHCWKKAKVVLFWTQSLISIMDLSLVSQTTKSG